jgi:hypothetical protein
MPRSSRPKRKEGELLTHRVLEVHDLLVVADGGSHMSESLSSHQQRCHFRLGSFSSFTVIKDVECHRAHAR